MRKLVVLLTIVALVSSVMTVLAGCGSAAPAEQPVAAPKETTSLLKEPTATVATPLVEDSVLAPTPVPSGGDGLEFAPVRYSSRGGLRVSTKLPRRLPAKGLNLPPSTHSDLPRNRNP